MRCCGRILACALSLLIAAALCAAWPMAGAYARQGGGGEQAVELGGQADGGGAISAEPEEGPLAVAEPVDGGAADSGAADGVEVVDEGGVQSDDGVAVEAQSDDDAPLEAQASAAHVAYHTHVQSIGWQPYVKDGEVAGTSGQAKRLEGIEIN